MTDIFAPCPTETPLEISNLIHWESLFTTLISRFLYLIVQARPSPTALGRHTVCTPSLIPI